jgi:hypothetical protein
MGRWRTFWREVEENKLIVVGLRSTAYIIEYYALGLRRAHPVDI